MKNQGFTLLELMIAIAVLSIIALYAVPGMGTLMRNNQVTTAKNALVASLQIARAESATTGRNVVLCPSSNGRQCQTVGDWSQGWLIYRDDNLNGRFDPMESLVLTHTQAAGTLTIRTSDGRRKLTYRGYGRADGSNVRFVFCDAGLSTGGQVVVANSGRIRSTDRVQFGDCGA